MLETLEIVISALGSAFFVVAVKEYIVVVSAVIFNTEKKILIAKRSEDEDVLPGYFGIPGGKVEEDSNTSDVLIHAVKREIMEEVGIEVEVLSLLNSHIGKDEKSYLFFSYASICQESLKLWRTQTQYIGWDLKRLRNSKSKPLFCRRSVQRLVRKFESKFTKLSKAHRQKQWQS